MLRMMKLCQAPIKVLTVLMAWIVGAGPNLTPSYADSKFPKATRIQHLVIVFQENISFDHYLGTYPNATNPHDEAPFYAEGETSTVNAIREHRDSIPRLSYRFARCQSH